ncbi:MAG: phenylalanine--tRNA ligase subunit alpha [Gammaproteobacteria bacterium]
MRDVEALKREFSAAVKALEHATQLEALRVAYLGKKGLVRDLFSGMKSSPKDQRVAYAQQLNAFKAYIETTLEQAECAFRKQETDRRIREEWTDLSLPGTTNRLGALHPLTQIERHCLSVLNMLGFQFEDGPEVETPFHNFDALNIPEHHPARDMQDTFWLDGGFLLRSHTSTVQVRVLEKQKELPIRIVSPGRVYRNEAVDATHLACFHQFEGLWVDKGVTFAHLKGTLEFIVKHVFGDEWACRFKPKFYPYTEPSIGVDIRSKTDDATWITVLGAGMVHPNVFKATGYDPNEVSGFAFGLGVSRMVTMAHQVENMKSLYEGDLRVHQGLARKQYR